MVCIRCNAPTGETERCATCGMPLKTLEHQRTRGWIAAGAGALMAMLMGAVWFWVNRIMAANAPLDAQTQAFLQKIDVAFALIVASGIFGTLNGALMVRTGRRNTLLVVALLASFVLAMYFAWSASSGYHPASSVQ